MNRTFLRWLPMNGVGPIAAAALLALSSGTAFAATYVSAPLPTEFGGGVVPADPKVLKNDQKASATIAKLAATVEKCYSKGVGNFSKAKPDGVATCLSDPAKGVIPKFQAKIAAITLPPCADFATLQAQVEGISKAANNQYCACSQTVATVSTTYGGSASAVSTFLGYPDDQLDIPGFGSQQSVIDRVDDLTGVVGGTFSYADTDTNANTLDDQIAVGLISLSQAFPQGPFVSVTLDCKAGQAAAIAADFGCTLDASDNNGAAIPGTCAVSSVSYVP